MKRVAFVNGFIFNSESEEFYRASVLCDDGIITDIILGDVPSGYEIVDLDGKYLIPGLIDVHTHGLGGLDFNFANADNVRFMREKYAKMGTTSIMATLASDTYEGWERSISAINENSTSEAGHANVIGIHLEGRYLNPEMKGAHALEFLVKPNAIELEALYPLMTPYLVHASIAPELEGGDEFIKKANELGVTVGIAHTNASYNEAMHALELGAISFTHTYNAMTKIHHRMPGATVVALTEDNAMAELICDGYHSHPAMVRLAYKSKPSNKLVLITDSIALACTDEGFESEVAGVSVVVKGGVAVNKFGVIAGSTLTMFHAMTNFMEFCGISLCEAIKYATVNPANMVKAQGVGKIAPSYRADFIAIKDITEPEIDAVYLGADMV